MVKVPDLSSKVGFMLGPLSYTSLHHAFGTTE